MLNFLDFESIIPFVSGLLVGTGVAVGYRNLRPLLSGRLSDLATHNKLVLVVRNDIAMSKGKTAAQCSHAAVECYKATMLHNPQKVNIWLANNQRKIVVGIGTGEKGLFELAKVAKSHKVISCIITDSGLTKVKPGTCTVMGIGPDNSEIIDKITGHLKLI